MPTSNIRPPILSTSVVALAVLGLSVAVTREARADDGPTAATARAYQRLLDRFDANHDRRLQVSELPASLRPRLGQADTDRDGVISIPELHAFGVQRRAARFARADKNRDGKLEPSEVGAERWQWLEVADANGDGAVTLEEIERAVANGTLVRPAEED